MTGIYCNSHIYTYKKNPETKESDVTGEPKK